MKKIIRNFIVILFLLVSKNAFGQEFKYGITVGVNANNADWTYCNNNNWGDCNKIGFQIGALGELGFEDLSKGWYSEFGLLLVNKGYKLTSGYYCI